MSKRSAATELTDRNWDDDEETEDAGEFTRANAETIQNRQIIKAKRRNVQENAGKSAFSGFGGFSFKPTQTSTPLFSGGLFKSEAKTAATAGEKRKEEEEHVKDEDESPKKRTKTDTNASKDTETNGCSSERTTYLSNLKGLNVSVLKWIQQHIDKNPYCILTPIFKDYEAHLEEVEKGFRKQTNGDDSTDVKKQTSVMQTDKPYSAKSGLTMGMGNLDTKQQSLMQTEKPYTAKSGLTVGMGGLETKSDSQVGFPAFSFKPTATTASGGSGFNFMSGGATSSATGSGFSFAVGSSTVSGSRGGAGKEEEEYVPPVVETVQHNEEGSLYSKKCKLFYQKDGAWTERGVGYLHLKKTDNIAQLLIRADTTLGNILLNVRLTESMPLSRQGKNNVSIMSVIHPAIPKVPSDKPVPMLIRVKTGNDADELLDKMEEVRS